MSDFEISDSDLCIIELHAFLDKLGYEVLESENGVGIFDSKDVMLKEFPEASEAYGWALGQVSDWIEVAKELIEIVQSNIQSRRNNK